MTVTAPGEASAGRGPGGRGPGGPTGPPTQRLAPGVVWTGAALFAVLMVLSPRYGFHRDELYFLDCARHLQASYVDQPIVTPLLARLSLVLFGVNPAGLRVWSALAAWATVVVAGLTARELGGGRRAQLVAALGVATMPTLLGADHLAGPTALDLLAWAAVALFVLRVGRRDDPRWWLAAGLALGIGLANKHSVGFLAVAVLAGALLSGDRRLVLNRWAAAGALLALLWTVPDLVWQAQHGWATIAMTRSLNAENGGPGNIPTFVVGQLFSTNPFMDVVWIAGLRWLWRSTGALQRALAWAYGLLFVFFALTTGAKTYYLAGAYVYLLAAGAVALESWLGSRRRRRNGLVAVALTTLATVPLVLPVLPASEMDWAYGINPAPGESIGWPELVSTVDTAWRSLPSGQRARAVIFTADYGEAGAINELGRGLGMPVAVSGHNSEWWWGPGDPTATTVLAVAPGPRDVTGYGQFLAQYFSRVRVVATIGNRAGVHNQEWGGHVYVCTGPHQAWARLWPRLRHYD